jgi:hypothetical protein
MTDQEQQLIAGLAERIHNAPAPQIDRDANDLIQRAIGSRPDALYILTQTVLLQEMALNQTKAQLEELKRQTGTSANFLNAPPAQYQAPQYQPPPPPQSYGGGLSGFLHQAATTAAGVLAGEVAFDALSGLFGHHGGYGGGFFGGGGIVPGGETIVNNYYNDPATGGGMGDGIGGDGSRFSDAAASSGDQMSSDIEDDRDNSGDAFASSDNDSQDDGSSGFDDSGSGGGDDGGGF